MGNWIHQVEEGCIFVEDLIKRCSLKTQVLLRKKENKIAKVRDTVKLVGLQIQVDPLKVTDKP